MKIMPIKEIVDPSLATSSINDERLSNWQPFSPASKMIIAIASWALAAWSAFVLLSSLPYKFSGHPITQHIFTTIGEWIGTTVNVSLGAGFAAFGAVGIGSLELITALILLLPALLWQYSAVVKRPFGPSRSLIHACGGLMAVALMAGAIFFHLFTPLGIHVIVNGVSDEGSLFKTAVSVVIAGLLLVAINRHALTGKR